MLQTAEVQFSDKALTSAGFAQRVKALATTAPLHDLDAGKAQVQSADYTVYQMAELALHVIDLVTMAMDFDTGARPVSVLKDLAAGVAAQAPDRALAEHERIASRVLENLLNFGSTDGGFRIVNGLTGPGGYERHTFAFKLLEETRGLDGDLYLRASKEAVNILVGALKVDLEAAHIAADVRPDTRRHRCPARSGPSSPADASSAKVSAPPATRSSLPGSEPG